MAIEIGSIATKTLAKQLAKACVDYLKSRQDKYIRLIDASDVETGLDAHLKFVKNWVYWQPFVPSRKGSKELVYIGLELSRSLRRQSMTPAEAPNSDITVDHALGMWENLVILGEPGSGKTSTVKHICRHLFETEATSNDPANFPLVVRLSDLRNDETLFDRIASILSIHVSPLGNDANSEWVKARGKTVLQDAAISLLDKLKPRVVLDGLDELPVERLDDIVKEIQLLFCSCDNARSILTSRHGCLEHGLDNSRMFELLPFGRPQIEQFASAWFRDTKTAEQFLEALERSPFTDTAGRPLLLANLCVLYDRSGAIPEKPKTVYKKLTNLLLTEWDEQNRNRRVSQYGKFEPDRKAEFLASLAFDLKSNNVGRSISGSDLKASYGRIHREFALPEDECLKVVKEIESHTGLIVKSSYDTFDYSHKSFQEYFIADFLVRNPNVLSIEDTHLREFSAELAVAVCLSSGASDMLGRLLAKYSLSIEEAESGAVFSGALSMFIARLELEGPDLVPRLALGRGAALCISRHLSLLHSKYESVAILTIGRLWMPIGVAADGVTMMSSGGGLDFLCRNKSIKESVRLLSRYYRDEADIPAPPMDAARNFGFSKEPTVNPLERYTRSDEQLAEGDDGLPQTLILPKYMFSD